VRALIEAFGRVQHELPHDLVITGGAWLIDVPFDDLLSEYGIAGRVRRLGAVPKNDLIALYNAADAFVFPSRYEGFGIPPLEAFACGCPVVSSNATSLPEVVGDAALTFDPLDVRALAAHLKAVATDRELRERLVRAGYNRVQQFSYRRAAQELLRLLEEAAT
jgi:glycosyltransferase involved in cell wall biosynthesis